MTTFLSNMNSLTGFVFNTILQVWAVIQSQPLLLAPVGLWVLRKLFHVFDLIKG